MSSVFWLLSVFNTYCIIITYSQNYLYNNNYTLSQSNWEATCLFYYDAHLASIHNQSQFLEAQTTALNTAWIGASDTAEEGTWRWTDNTAFNYGLNYSQLPWASGEPNDQTPGEDCVELRGIYIGLWNDVSCSYLNYGLCAFPIPTHVINDKSSYVRIRQQPGYIGMIDILDEIYIEFYITFTSWPAGWGNILQFGNNDTQKYPGIYINGVTHNVMSSFATVTTSNPEQSTTTSGYALNTEYHYTLYQTQRRLTVTFGGDYVYDDIYNYTAEVAGVAVSHPIVINQAINLGSNWDDDFDATIRNLVVTTANSPETTFWNYICDWDDRWTTRNGGTWSWAAIGSGIDGDCSIQQSSTAADGRIAWMGEKDPTSLLWTDYKLEMIINLISGNGVGPIFRATNFDCDVNNCGNSYQLKMKTDGYYFGKVDDSFITLYTHSMGAGAHSLDTLYLVRVECVGNTFKIYEENEYLFTYSDDSYSAGSVGFRTWGSDARISKVRITFPQNQQRYTANPSMEPTFEPTFEPTSVPTSVPTTQTKVPTTFPTKSPTFAEQEQEQRETTDVDSDYESNIDGNKSNNLDVYITVIIIVICFIFGVAALCFYKCWKKKQSSKIVKHVEMANVKSSGYHEVVVADMNETYLDIMDKTDIVIMDNVYGVNVVETDGGHIDDFDHEEKQIIVNEPGSMPKHAENGLIEGIDYDINEDGAKEINAWLDSIGLLRYYDMFIQNGFDSLEMIQEINNESDLNRMGITLLAHQIKIINHIKKAH